MMPGIPVRIDNKWTRTRLDIGDWVLLVAFASLFVIGAVNLATGDWASALICMVWALVMTGINYTSWRAGERSRQRMQMWLDEMHQLDALGDAKLVQEGEKPA